MTHGSRAAGAPERFSATATAACLHGCRIDTRSTTSTLFKASAAKTPARELGHRRTKPSQTDMLRQRIGLSRSSYQPVRSLEDRRNRPARLTRTSELIGRPAASMLRTRSSTGIEVGRLLVRRTSLAARGESAALHRDRRGARLARREEGEYREYLTDEQRSKAGCIGGRMQRDFHHGLLVLLCQNARFG